MCPCRVWSAWGSGLRAALAGSLVALTASACSSPTSLSPNTATAPVPLTVTGTSLFTAIGQTGQLTASNAAGVAVTSGLTWQSAGPGVATVSATGLVTATGFGTASIEARGATGTGGLTIFVVPPASAPKTVSACGVLTTPGSYVLSTDLSFPNGVPGTCFGVSGAAAVQIDCRGHVVPSFILTGVNTVTVSNCTVTNALNVSGATSVTITNCTVNGGVSISGSTAVAITNSTIAAQTQGLAAIAVFSGTHIQLQANTISGAVALYAVYFANGTGNQVLGNVISGTYSGGTANAGTDDGVLLISETGDAVQGNTIRNFFDAGVEGVDFVANSLVTDNTISNVGAAGIGSYWCTDWTSNVIRNNSVSVAPTLLYASYSVGLGQCGPASLAGAFSGNQVIGNRFRSPIPGTLISVPTPVGFAPTTGPVPRVIIALQGPVTNNLVQGNDLGTNDGPFLSPLSGFVDGGGNLCGPTNPAVSNFPCAGVGSPSAVTRRR
jgi:hypothetical protein